MKIVFPYDGFESLGIGYLSSIAMSNGYDVDLYPLRFGDYITGYSSRNNRNIIKAKDAIMELKPDIVAFSLNSFMAGSFIKLALALRQSGIRTIAGGPHCTAEPEFTAASNAFNGVVAGEAENVFIPAVEAIHKDEYDLPWLFTQSKKTAEYASIKDIDNLPFPAKELFYRINRFEAQDYKIITSRGCPYNCIFCSHSNPRLKSTYRRRSIGNIIEELIAAKHNYRIRTVYFLDDAFTVNHDWIKELMKIYKQKINLPFHAICHPNNTNEEVIDYLKEGGCYAVRLGVQTSTERIKKIIGRTENNQKVADTINYFKKTGIKVEIDHLVDLPGESLDEARECIKFYNNKRPDAIKVYWLMPLPGTTWFNQSLEQKLITPEQALKIKSGESFGRHSYLFYNKTLNNSKWLGIHFLLSWLPLLPKAFVSFLIKIKADRFLKIPSFFLIVGIPRFLNMSGRWDMVGRDHLKRIIYTIKR